MGPILHSKSVRFLGLLTLTALACCHVYMALQLQREFSDRKVTHPEVDYRRNPRMLTWHARQRHLLGSDSAATGSLYRQALAINPVYIPAWLGLAELYNDTGNRQAADAVMDLVDRYTLDIKRYRWDKVLVAYQMQRKDILQRDLAYLIAEMQGKTRDDALRMAFTLWPDPAELLRLMGAGNRTTLFGYAVRTKKTDAALALWDSGVQADDSLEQKEITAFIQLLMNENHLERASQLWRQRFGPEALLYDGKFVEKPMQNAFGWRLGTVKGASWRIEKPGQELSTPALHFHFQHQENVDLSIPRQIVPLAGGGQFHLKGRWRSKSLTTDQRPFIEVVGYNCQTPAVRTEMIAPTQSWEEFALDFTVPDNCQAMMIRVRRLPSRHIDNLLGGDFWLADLSIESSTIAIAPLVEITR